MFITATKVAIVEALRSVWFADQNTSQEAHIYRSDLSPNDRPFPRRITLEYPEESTDWPAILVQVRPHVITWTGITPDEIVTVADGTGQPQYKRIRQGYFEATCMLEILALTSEERDRIWDNLVKLLMMGRKRAPTKNFHDTLASHDLVGITANEGSVRPLGDSIGMGTPWNPELITYEAAIEFDMTGVFYADEYTEELVPIENARVYNYISFEGGTDLELPPKDSDGLGEWKDPWA